MDENTKFVIPQDQLSIIFIFFHGVVKSRVVPRASYPKGIEQRSYIKNSLLEIVQFKKFVAKRNELCKGLVCVS